jgi:hypothetical protein
MVRNKPGKELRFPIILVSRNGMSKLSPVMGFGLRMVQIVQTVSVHVPTTRRMDSFIGQSCGSYNIRHGSIDLLSKLMTLRDMANKRMETSFGRNLVYENEALGRHKMQKPVIHSSTQSNNTT